VLGKAAMYLNARIPELTEVQVSSPEELEDFEDILDEFTGAVIDRLVYFVSTCMWYYRVGDSFRCFIYKLDTHELFPLC